MENPVNPIVQTLWAASAARIASAQQTPEQREATQIGMAAARSTVLEMTTQGQTRQEAVHAAEAKRLKDAGVPETDERWTKMLERQSKTMEVYAAIQGSLAPSAVI